MIEVMIIALCLLLFITGSISDFKWRIVPDWVSYTSVVTGIALHLLISIQTLSWTPLLESILGGVLFLVLGTILFYLKQWGGGDAKILMGFGTIVGLQFTMNAMILSFLINLLLIGGLYGLLWFIVLGLKRFTTVKKEVKKNLQNSTVKSIKKGLLWLSAAFLVLGFLLHMIELFILLSISLLFIFYVMVVSKSVEKVCFIIDKKVHNLEEGDWIVEDVKLGKKTINAQENIGLSLQEISDIQSYAKKHNMKTIKVKEGIPFVPGFLVTYVFTLYIGSSFFILVL